MEKKKFKEISTGLIYMQGPNDNYYGNGDAIGYFLPKDYVENRPLAFKEVIEKKTAEEIMAGNLRSWFPEWTVANFPLCVEKLIKSLKEFGFIIVSTAGIETLAEKMYKEICDTVEWQFKGNRGMKSLRQVIKERLSTSFPAQPKGIGAKELEEKLFSALFKDDNGFYLDENEQKEAMYRISNVLSSFTPLPPESITF